MTAESTIRSGIAKYIRDTYPDVIFRCDESGENKPKRAGRLNKYLRSSNAMPDLFISEPRGGFYGLYVELKADGFKLKKSNSQWTNEHIQEQAIMLDRLNNRGYCATFAVGYEEARGVIDGYLALK